MKKGLHKFKKVCYDNPRWETGMIFGPVAQLGERTVRIRKVVGSNPFRSTIGRISEPYIVWGTVFVQTKRHFLS